MDPILIVLIVVAATVFWGISVYNWFVSSKGRIKASIQEIGNQLKRQVELIPNLETSAKSYLKHEKEVFQMLVDARKQVVSSSSSSDMDKMSKAQDQLSQALSRLQVVVESNPELKAQEVISKLMDELRDTSDKLMYSRRSLIDVTADYNIRLATFPDSFIAKMFKFTPEKGFETPDSGSHLELKEHETKSPKISI